MVRCTPTKGKHANTWHFFLSIHGTSHTHKMKPASQKDPASLLLTKNQDGQLIRGVLMQENNEQLTERVTVQYTP